MPNPTISPAILLSPVETGYVAYDPVGDRLHQLNPVAALLAELCDGSRTVEDIRALAGPFMPDGKIAEIDRWIDEAIKAGLLTWQGAESAAHREFSADELFGFSKRLNELGKVQTAYLCCKRTVELRPEKSDAWYALGDMAQSLGRRTEARHAYETYLELRPGDAEIEQILVALKDETPPPRAPDRCIQQIYRDFASHYESQMRDDLKYQGPERIADMLQAVLGEHRNLKVLDLGCGSGLAGVSLKERASAMVGVDLSPEMLGLARARNIYDQLEVAEITAWLEGSADRFDLIACCDCLIYFGDLSPVVSAAAKRLNPGGVFVITTERGDRHPFHLSDSGRYTHHPEHLREAAAAGGLMVARLDEAFLRMEYGAEVIGLFAALTK